MLSPNSLPPPTILPNTAYDQITMDLESSDRTRRLIGPDGLAAIEKSSILVVGVGGVGSCAAEALARAGVGHITVIDDDVVSRSNINRQLIALESTLGRFKTDVIRERLLDINPQAQIDALTMRYSPDTSDKVILKSYDFVLDAIDTVSCKIELIVRASADSVPIISAMGTGNKTDPSQFAVTDIFATDQCHLARIMRKKLRKKGINKLTVVYSPEPPSLPFEDGNSVRERHQIAGTISFMPAAAGLLMAAHVLNTIVKTSTSGRR